jgi:hypothetical protein
MQMFLDLTVNHRIERTTTRNLVVAGTSQIVDSWETRIYDS